MHVWASKIFLGLPDFALYLPDGLVVKIVKLEDCNIHIKLLRVKVQQARGSRQHLFDLVPDIYYVTICTFFFFISD
jgi:hypothetical protein